MVSWQSNQEGHASQVVMGALLLSIAHLIQAALLMSLINIKCVFTGAVSGLQLILNEEDTGSHL